MEQTGIYAVVDNTSEMTQYLWLGGICFIILALMCFRLWPLWLKKGVYLCSFYLLVFLVITAFVRVILWGILWHFGIEFWLFPNYFIDSNDPRDSFWPLYSFEVRDDQGSSAAIILRIFSGILLVYLGFQFVQDEKNLEDLAELRDHGLHDLFEYGQEFVLGNALGDGGAKKNNTFQRAETF